MTEFQNVRQIPGEGRRRWFCDNYFDLIVWYKEEEIIGFQLCYDRAGSPRAWTWQKDCGCRHNGIDDGDDPLLTYKTTPILVSDGVFDLANLKPRFVAAARALPAEIRERVLGVLYGEEQGSANTASYGTTLPRRP